MKTKKQKSALEGAVVARFIIDTDGEIINPVIIKSLNSYSPKHFEFIFLNSKINPAV